MTALAAGCGGGGGGPSFLYKPNKPLWPGHDAQAPLFAVKAGVMPLHDLTPYADKVAPISGEERADLTRGPFGRWPQLSAEAVRAAPEFPPAPLFYDASA
ncbi:MAG TPA: hypothetical protein VNK24_07440 [Elusimicrobiota bacterium]|nr:hypothetical protein [Elusimicrobiota bacterium]